MFSKRCAGAPSYTPAAPATQVANEKLESHSSRRIIGAVISAGSSMIEGKLGLNVHVGTLLVLAKPPQSHDDHGAIRVEDNEASK